MLSSCPNLVLTLTAATCAPRGIGALLRCQIGQQRRLLSDDGFERIFQQASDFQREAGA
jgi:hypothetical protein